MAKKFTWLQISMKQFAPKICKWGGSGSLESVHGHAGHGAAIPPFTHALYPGPMPHLSTQARDACSLVYYHSSANIIRKAR